MDANNRKVEVEFFMWFYRVKLIFPDSKISIYIARTKLQIISVKKTKGKVNRSFKYGYAYFLSDLSHQKKGKFNFIWDVRPITVCQKRVLMHALD